MPIYEYYCPETHKIYSFYARSLKQAETPPKCPDNPNFTMKKAVSQFAVMKGLSEPIAGKEIEEEDDPRMEAAMQEMERMMAGMDEDNPDPKMMGQMMRRLSEISGEPMDPAMQEMMGRLEKGEDPEKLEEQFGDLLDEGADPEGLDAPAEKENATASRWRRLKRQLPPAKDPVLYEWNS